MNLMIYAFKVGKKEVVSGFGGCSNGGAKKEGEGKWENGCRSCEREGVSWVNGDGD